MKLFSFAAICFFGVLAVVSAEPGSFFIGECIGCNKVVTPKTEENNTQSANSETKPVAKQGQFFIGKCTNCTENEPSKNATNIERSATADPVAASSNDPLHERLAEILSRANAITGTEEGAALSTTSKPVANQGSFYIGECINCNKPKTANSGNEQVDKKGQFFIGKCTNCTENEPSKNAASKAENVTANKAAKALIKVKTALDSALLLLQKLDPKEVYLGTWRNYAIIARPMF
ncbi:hypothetical protein ACLKA7_009224 [Drosophila subpalustris]